MKPYLAQSPQKQRSAFLTLKTPRQVADLLEVDYGRLVYHLYKVPDDEKYAEFHIPKRSGGKREILAPATALKILQRKLAQILLNVYKIKPSVYGFVEGRNVVDNARRHRNRRFVFNIHLEDFFPSINFGRVRGLFIGKPYYLPENVATVLAQICCHRNYLPQGAPTSPIVSNMICAKMDSELQELAGRNKCIYTRYADDMTFSTSTKEFPSRIARWISITDVHIGDELEAVVAGNGFRLNKGKVRLQPWFRRQQVTGLTVNQFPNVRRVYVRQIRAMLHAWNKFGLGNAEKEFFSIHDHKYRNEDLEFPSFRQVVRGKIEYLGMVRGHSNEIYRRFLQQFRQLNSRDRGVPSFIIASPDELNLPRIYTEGKTDTSILMTAWKKLFEDLELSFRIQPSDPFAKSSSSGGSGGATRISAFLNNQRYDSTNISIGLFDRDQEGIREYKRLAKDFIEDSDADWRISIPRKSGAFLLPVPEGKERYVYFDNLSIEFYFSEEALMTRTEDGLGLEFDYPKSMVRGKELPADEQKQVDEARSIRGGKKVFADSIIPHLEPEEFEPFKSVFEKIFELIMTIQDAT